MKTPIVAVTLVALLATAGFLLVVPSATSTPASPSLASEVASPRDGGRHAPITEALPSTDERTRPSTDSLAVEGGGAYSAAIGSRFRFDLVTDSRVQFGADEASEVGQTLEGSLTTTVVDRRGDALVVELQLDVRPTILGGEVGSVKRMTQELALPILVKMKNDGHVDGLRFADGTSRRVCDVWRGLVSSFRFVISDEPKWESNDLEPNGVARFGYRWTGLDDGLQSGGPSRPTSTSGGSRNTLERIRIGFEAAAEFDEIGGAPNLDGIASARIDSSLGWRVDATYREEFDRVAGGMLDVSGWSRGSLTLAQAGRVASTMLPKVDWDAPWASLAASAEVESNGSPLAFEKRFWSERLEGMTVTFMASRLAQLIDQEEVDLATLVAAKKDVEWMLRLQPSSLSEVESLLSAFGPDVSQVLLSATGAVGSAACQGLLVRTAADRGQPDELRHASLMGMVAVDHPNADMLGSLERIFALGSDDPIRGTAMLVAGALAGLTEQGDAAIEPLLAARPGDPSELDLWIVALGNTKSERVVSTLQEFTHHDDPDIRDAAIEAITNTDRTEMGTGSR